MRESVGREREGGRASERERDLHTQQHTTHNTVLTELAVLASEDTLDSAPPT